MKLKSIKKKIWSIVIIITTLIGILPVQANTTETPVKDVELVIGLKQQQELIQ